MNPIRWGLVYPFCKSEMRAVALPKVPCFGVTEGCEPAFLPNLCSFPLSQFAGVTKRDIFPSITHGRQCDVPGHVWPHFPLASLEERPVACLDVL